MKSSQLLLFMHLNACTQGANLMNELVSNANKILVLTLQGVPSLAFHSTYDHPSIGFTRVFLLEANLNDSDLNWTNLDHPVNIFTSINFDSNVIKPFFSLKNPKARERETYIHREREREKEREREIERE